MLAVVYSAVGQVTRGSLPVLTDQHAFVVSHISSVSHVVLVGTSGGSVPISTIAHVSSVTHISAAGTPWAFNMALSVRCVNTGATAFESCAGTSTLDAIAHVSGALHIAGTIRGAAFHVQGLGTPGASHGGVLSVQGVAGGNPIVVNVQHISGAVHLASNVTDNANNAIRVTGVTVFSIQGAVSHNSGQLHVAGTGISPQFTMFRVNCGSTAATAVSVTTTRKRVILQNVGTLPIYIGGGHVTVTASNAFTLHAVSAPQNAATTSRLELTDFQGRVDCISDGPGQTLEVLQVIGGR